MELPRVREHIGIGRIAGQTVAAQPPVVGFVGRANGGQQAKRWRPNIRDLCHDDPLDSIQCPKRTTAA
jgi:hypothetical protein